MPRIDGRLTLLSHFHDTACDPQVPSRYLGNEFGAIHKPWGSAAIRFCLTYPEIYELGASNLVRYSYTAASRRASWKVQHGIHHMSARLAPYLPHSLSRAMSLVVQGHIILYTVLNEVEGLLCDRAYFPGAAPLAAVLAEERYS